MDFSPLGPSFFREFFESSPLAMCIYSFPDGRFLATNRAAQTRYGFTEEEFLQMTLFDIRPPDQHHQLREELNRILQTDQPSPPTIREHRAKSGRLLFTEVISSEIRLEGRKVRLCLLRDATREHVIEEELSRFYEFSHDIIAIRSNDSGTTAYSPAFEKNFGTSKSQAVTNEPEKLSNQKALAETELNLHLMSQDGVPRSWECQMLARDGSLRCIQWSGIVDPDKYRSYAVGRDVTDQRRADESTTWLAAIVSSSSEAIVGKSLDGIILSWNAAAVVLFGYSAEEMVGQSTTRLVPPHRQGERIEILDQVRSGDRVVEVETERIKRDGLIFDVSLTISPIRDKEGLVIGAAMICRDISARKEADRHLAEHLSQITALRQIDETIVGTFNLPLTLDTVVSQALATADVEAAFIFLRDRTSGKPQLFSKGQREGERELIRKLDLAMSLSIRSIECKAPIGTGSIPETFLGPHQDRHIPNQFDARPLLNHGRIVGVMVVEYKAQKRTMEQFQYLDALAHQAAIAIDSNRLYSDLQESKDNLVSACEETLEGWARALDLRDKETEGHSRRVTDLTMKMAHRIGFSADALVHIRRGALLHDIGKLGIPDHILLKPGPLTEIEWVKMKLHPEYGRSILDPIEFLRPALDIPFCHHEKWDGSGYPRGLSGENIPLPARVFALADVWDALTSDRPYRKGWPRDQVCAYIIEQSGLHFDPSLVPIFLELVT